METRLIHNPLNIRRLYCTANKRADALHAEVVPVGTEALEGLAVEHLAVVRMGDADHELGPLLKGLAIKVDGAVLGDDPVRVRARSHYAGAGIKGRHDLVLPLVCTRREGGDGLASLGS